jgi:hypothetical protein
MQEWLAGGPVKKKNNLSANDKTDASKKPILSFEQNLKFSCSSVQKKAFTSA